MAQEPAKSPPVKKCFVVSEFGNDDKTRLERNQMLKHLVRKVLVPMGYTVQRADEIDDLGQITHQVIERLIDDDVVDADLTGLNPNVFYELAVRHAARKPVVTLMTIGQTIPFDIKDVRTVFYDLHDPDALEAAQADLRQKVEAIEENPVDVRNPITVARNVTLLQQSDDPDVQVAGAVLEAVNQLRDEMRGLLRQPSQRRTGGVTTAEMLVHAKRRLLTIIGSGVDGTVAELAVQSGFPEEIVREALEAIVAEVGSDVFLVDGKYSRIPF